MMCLFSPPPRPLPRLLYFEHLVPLSSPTYPGYYAALSRRKELFSPADAYRLCLEAIQARLTPRAIAALLDHCPPAEAFCLPQESWTGFSSHLRALTEEACRYSRADVLDQLLRRGADPLSPSSCGSLLTTAILLGSLPCTRRLLQEERLDTTMTRGLLELWAGSPAARSSAVYRCLRLAAPRLTGRTYPRRGLVPLLLQLRPEHAAAAGNLPLFCRICQSPDPVTEEEGEAAVNGLFSCGAPLTQLSRPLDALFTACPGLLRRPPAQRLLFLCRLFAPLEAPLLDPWLARLPQRQIPLWEDSALGGMDWLDFLEEEGLLTRYQRLAPLPVIPVLDRNAPLPLRWNRSAGVSQLLRLCPVQGEPPAGELSALARDVLSCAGEKLVQAQLLPGGFLTREDPQALAGFCTGPDCPPRLAGLILSHTAPVPPEGDYLL